MTLYEHYEEFIFMRYPAHTRALREYTHDITRRADAKTPTVSRSATRCQFTRNPGSARLVYVLWSTCKHTHLLPSGCQSCHCIWHRIVYATQTIMSPPDVSYIVTDPVKVISNLMVTHKMSPPPPPPSTHFRNAKRS